MERLSREDYLTFANGIIWESHMMADERQRLTRELFIAMAQNGESVLHKKTLEQKVEETVDRLIELEKIRPEERAVTIQALIKANQGYLGGGSEDDDQEQDQDTATNEEE